MGGSPGSNALGAKVREHSIWRLSEGEAQLAGGVLGRAFVDEPIIIQGLPDEADRQRLCPPLFISSVRHACRYGEAWAVGPQRGTPVVVAYWVPRPEPVLSAAETAELGYHALEEEWGAALAVIGNLEGEAARKLDYLPQPWRYLGAIGVEPEQQGQGWGGLLLRRLLADAAAAGEAMGLVTDRARNVPFYERAGFEVVAQGETAGGTFAWWSMATPPPK